MLLKAQINIIKYTKLMIIMVMMMFIALIAIDIFIENFLLKKEIEKNQAITKIIAKNISDFDNMLNRNFNSALIGWSAMVDQGKAMTM